MPLHRDTAISGDCNNRGRPDRQWLRFEAIIRSDPALMRLLMKLRELGLPEWRLVAGCLYQTVWNVLT